MTKILNAALIMAVAVLLCASRGVLADKSAAFVIPMPEPGQSYVTGSPISKHGQLSVTSGKIVNSTGTQVQLKGMSTFWSNSGTGGPYFNEMAISWLAHDWRVDVVRVAMGAQSDGTNPGYTDGAAESSEGLARAAVEAGIKRGIYVIIDWHAHKNLATQASAFFKKMATDYGKYPNVIYEIWNEPEPANAQDVQTYAATVNAAIRAIDSKNIIIVGSPTWSSEPNNVTVSGTNIAYSMHFYAASHGDNYRQRLKSALDQGKAVFATEWGTSNAQATGGYSESESTKWLDFLDQNKVGWTNWAVTHDNTNVTSILSKGGAGGNWAAADLSTSGRYIRGKLPSGNGGTYTVSVAPAQGGTVTGGKSAYNWGENVSLTAAPNAGWELKTWKGHATGNTLNLASPLYGMNLNVSAEFYDGGVIKNGHFTYDFSNWTKVDGADARAATLSVSNSECVVDITAAGSDLVRLSQGSSTLLTTGNKYRLTFKARSDAPRTVIVRLASSNFISTYGDTLKAELTSSPKEFDKEFVVTRGAAVTGGGLAFYSGDKVGKWYLSEVRLKDMGPGTAVAFVPQPVRASWVIVKNGSGAFLRGPAGDGAKVSLYNMRGKQVRSMAASDGQILSVGAMKVSAGNYLLVVKNRIGAEVYKSRVAIAD